MTAVVEGLAHYEAGRGMASDTRFRSTNVRVMFRTAFTDLFPLSCPIALAPMGGSAGGELAAAGALLGTRFQATMGYARPRRK